MKKLLLATSVLAMSVSVAAAQNVTVGADGRMGVQRLNGVTSTQGRVRINFALARQGDNGLAFGGTFRIGQVWSNGTSAPYNGNGSSNGSLFVEAGGLRLTMGDIDGAVAQRVALYGGALGFTGNMGRPSTHGFNTGFTEGDTGTTSTVRADYTIGDFGVSLSTRPTVNRTGEIAFSYSIPNSVSVALGLSQNRNASLSVTYSAGDFGVGALVTRLRAGGANQTNYRVWGTYDIGAVRLGLTHTRGLAEEATALGVRYSLGGGANLHGVVESRRPRAGGTRHTGGEVGVTFAF